MSENKEGKLKLQIKEVTDRYDLRISAFGHIDVILDAAKVEWQQKGYYMPENPQPNRQGRMPCMLFVPLTFEEWFTRWFGSGKP